MCGRRCGGRLGGAGGMVLSSSIVLIDDVEGLAPRVSDEEFAKVVA